MTPSIGRIVHYRSYGTPGGEFPSVDRAAMVTEVKDDETVSLCVMNPTGLFFNQNVRLGDGPGQWHWPEIK